MIDFSLIFKVIRRLYATPVALMVWLLFDDALLAFVIPTSIFCFWLHSNCPMVKQWHAGWGRLGAFTWSYLCRNQEAVLFLVYNWTRKIKFVTNQSSSHFELFVKGENPVITVADNKEIFIACVICMNRDTGWFLLPDIQTIVEIQSIFNWCKYKSWNGRMINLYKYAS